MKHKQVAITSIAATFWESNACYFPPDAHNSDSLATAVRCKFSALLGLDKQTLPTPGGSNLTATVLNGTLNMLIQRGAKVSTLVVASSPNSDFYVSIPDMIYSHGVYALWQGNLVINGTGNLLRPSDGHETTRDNMYTYPTHGKSYYTADGGCLGETKCGGEEYFDGKHNPSTGQTDSQWRFAWGCERSLYGGNFVLEKSLAYHPNTVYSTMDISYLADMSWAVPFGIPFDEGPHRHCQKVNEGFRFQHKVRFEYWGVYAGSPRAGQCTCGTFCDQCVAY
ncbi:hypothetical protein BJ741DRAFT_595474 [Chytriomyces cf. hyalinus JEL632]|nr:hypothetical protein BJ741DRAFT_595474 [Chytriomyces cf. hyalinus JEL632]